VLRRDTEGQAGIIDRPVAPGRGLTYSADMTDRPDLDGLARRFLDLCEDQVGAWAADATLANSLRIWLGLFGPAKEGGIVNGQSSSNGTGTAAAPGTAATADPSGDGGDDLARLARQLAAFGRQFAGLEAGTSSGADGDRGEPRRRGQD
jgi:hypothetical protein